MIIGSDLFNNIVNDSNGARYYVRITDGNMVIDDEIDNFTYSGMCNDSDGLTLGTTCSAGITFTIKGPTVNFAGKELSIEQGVQTSNGNMEYIRLGYFTVLKPVTERGVTSYELVDRMTSKMNMPYFSELKYPTTDVAMIKEICQKTGVLLSDNNYKTHTISSALQGYTFREALSYLAQLQGNKSK